MMEILKQYQVQTPNKPTQTVMARSEAQAAEIWASIVWHKFMPVYIDSSDELPVTVIDENGMFHEFLVKMRLVPEYFAIRSEND